MNFDAKENDYAVQLTGAPFNDAYRYVDWLLTVPLLLIELILVMGLPAEETVKKAWSLGTASAVMVCLGYPGEIQDTFFARLIWWALAMIPFYFVVVELKDGLADATEKMHPEAASLTAYARWLTIISWCTYPCVYIVKMVGLAGVTATAAEQIGYSVTESAHAYSYHQPHEKEKKKNDRYH